MIPLLTPLRRAGADTTRLAISIVFMFMLRTPELYKRLQDEVDKALEHKEVRLSS